jgi:hypothetical protein
MTAAQSCKNKPNIKNNNFSFLLPKSIAFYQPVLIAFTAESSPYIKPSILRIKNFKRFRKRQKPETIRLSITK